MNTTLENIAEIIKTKNRILILAHKGPDGDAVGSGCAIGLALKKLGKKVHYGYRGIEERISNTIEETKYNGRDLERHFDLVICCDTSSFDYVENNQLIKRADMSVNIDHHMTNEDYCDYTYADASASACCEIIFELVKLLGVEFDHEIVESIFTGIWEDTGGMSFQNVTYKTYAIMSELYKIVPDLIYTISKLKTIERDRLELQRYALSNISYFKNDQLVVMSLLNDEIVKYNDTTGLIDLIKYVKGCLLYVLIKKQNDCYKVSLRSNTDDINVADFAVRYNGGGHSKAAGFNYSGDLADLINELEEAYSLVWTD